MIYVWATLSTFLFSLLGHKHYQYWVPDWVEDAALLHHDKTQYLSNQSWSFWIKQQTDCDFCTLTVYTEEEFPPCISLPYKMYSTGHSFTTSVQILICLVFIDIFSLPALFRACNLFFCLDFIVWFIPQFDFISDLIALLLAPALLFCYFFFLTSLLYDLS